MRNIEVGTAGDFCDNCEMMELDECGCYVDGIYKKNNYRCLHTDICKNAIKLFAKSKGLTVEEEPKEDDWMEDQI